MIITSENGEHVPHLDINEVILFHCNNVKNHYNIGQGSCINLNSNLCDDSDAYILET